MINHDDINVNEAWVVFKLNTVPLLTQEGDVNLYTLMDIGSSRIIGHVNCKEASAPNKQEVEKLFLKAWKEKEDWALKVILEEDSIATKVFEECAKNNGIATQLSSEAELKNVTGVIKKQFNETLQ